MQRLPDLEHRVVRRVYDGRDRSHARGEQTRLDGDRGRGMLNVADDPREVARAPLEVQDLERGDVLSLLRVLVDAGDGEDERRPRRGRHLARDPEHREEVWAVRRHLHVEDGVLEIERFGHVHPRLQAPGQHEDAVVRRRDAELVGGAQHPVGDDTPDLPSRERFGEREHGRSRRSERDEVPWHHVPNPDDHLELTGAGLDARDTELVAVRMVPHLDHPSDDDTRDALPRILDRLDLRPPATEELRELRRRKLRRAQLPEPGHHDLHATPSNCSRNRTSPSTSSRMSFTP